MGGMRCRNDVAPRAHKGDADSILSTTETVHVPFMRHDAWDNLTEVMGWAADTLNSVERGTLFEIPG
jgi:hypothetical protein